MQFSKLTRILPIMLVLSISYAGNHAHASGTTEAPKDRERRLKRECKGAVNAGLCQGYTQ